ncbi:MAG TPA: hemerythrin domain-containing protein [Flavisolibacter sp.]|nr:hemerythrin domain-containing protein [Flavisolibacter sp.]
MGNETNPIKRSNQLAPLSREHHEGLLFGWKIRQGLKNGADINTIGRFVQWFWEAHLQEHFRLEEQVLAAYMPTGDLQVDRMINEHQEIEALIHINENIVDEANLLQIADAIADHIRFEEREFFPHAEHSISSENLDKIYDQLSVEKVPPVKWEEEFWLKKA